MKIRILIAVMAACWCVADADARSPFGRHRSTVQSKPSTAAQSRRADAIRRLPASDEEVTRRFGPSILIRDSGTANRSHTFVNQPG